VGIVYCQGVALAVAAIMLLSSVTATRQSGRFLLTSAEQNLDVASWEISGRDTGIATETPWSVRKQRLSGGRQDGVDLVTIDNGRLTMTIVPTRGMGILRVVIGDLRLGWDSPVREVVHPKYVNLSARGGLGWLEGFNEWLARCGLEWAGPSGPGHIRQQCPRARRDGPYAARKGGEHPCVRGRGAHRPRATSSHPCARPR